MINITTFVGQASGIPIMDTTGLTSFPSLQLLTDYNVSTPNTVSSLGLTGLSTPVEISAGSGVYTTTFIAPTIGNFYVVYNGVVIAHITVDAYDVIGMLKNIEDEALGSWYWNKLTGNLTLIKQNSTTLATYNVVDTTSTSSRERV